MSPFFYIGLFVLIYTILSFFFPSLPVNWGYTKVQAGLIGRIGMLIFSGFLVLNTSGLITDSFSHIMIGGIITGLIIAIAGGFYDLSRSSDN